MKKSALILLSATLAIGSLSISPLTGNAEIYKEPAQEKFDRTADTGTPSLEIAKVPVISQIDSETTLYDWTLTPDEEEVSTHVVVPDGAVFTWEYVDTTYSSDVVHSQVVPWFGKIVSGGLSATIVGKIPINFFKGVAATLGGAATLSIKPTDVTYYKVVKSIDTDSYNIYLKYEVKQYSDKARTKLIKQWSEVHRV